MNAKINEMKAVLEDYRDDLDYTLEEIGEEENQPLVDMDTLNDLYDNLEEIEHEIESVESFIRQLEQQGRSADPNSLEYVGMSQNDFI